MNVYSQWVEMHRTVCWYKWMYTSIYSEYLTLAMWCFTAAVHQPIMWMKLNIVNMFYYLYATATAAEAGLAVVVVKAKKNFLFNCILNAPCNFVRVLVFAHIYAVFDPFRSQWETEGKTLAPSPSSWHLYLYIVFDILRTVSIPIRKDERPF